MFRFEIDREKVKTYIPILEKQEIAEEIAAGSIVRYHSTVRYADEDIFDSTICAEDAGLRQRFLFGVLTARYLGMTIEPVEGTSYLLSADDYDRAAENHPMNVLERLKADAKWRDAVFDLLRDFKDLERIINAEISARVAAGNDVLPRILDVLTQTATPEAMQRLADMEKQLGAQAKAIAGKIQMLRGDEADG